MFALNGCQIPIFEKYHHCENGVSVNSKHPFWVFLSLCTHMWSCHSSSRKRRNERRRKETVRMFVTRRARSLGVRRIWWREKVERGMKTGIRLVCEGRHLQGGDLPLFGVCGGRNSRLRCSLNRGYPLLPRKEEQGDTSPTRRQTHDTNPVRTTPRSRLTDAATAYVTLIADALQKNDFILIFLFFSYFYSSFIIPLVLG